MKIYYILIIGIILFECIIKDVFRRKKIDNILLEKQIFLFGASLMILGVMALRSQAVGADTARYIEIFNDHLYGTGMNVFGASKEWGFALFQNILSLFISYQFYIAIVSAIIVFSFYLFFEDYSDDLLLSIILHITIGLFAFTMSGIRQSLAICLTFLAFKYAKENKLIRFTVMVLVAYLFHNSAICFLPVFFIVKIKKLSKLQSILILSLIAAIGIFINPILYLIRFIVPERYRINLINGSGVNAKSFILFFGILILCAIVILYENSWIEGIQTPFFLLASITALVYAISPHIYLLDRISFYFIPYSIVLLSNTIKKMKHIPSRYVTMVITIAFCVFWFSISIPGETIKIDNYSFFWNDIK